jgi:hypothetical protein
LIYSKLSFGIDLQLDITNILNLNIMEHSKDSSKGREENQSTTRRGSEKRENKGSQTSKSENKGKGSSKK